MYSIIINQILLFVKDLLQNRKTTGSTKSVEIYKPGAATDKFVSKISSNQAAPTITPQQKIFWGAEPRITSNFCTRTLNGKKQWHGGIDFAAWRAFGSPIRSPESGIVIHNKKGAGGVTFVAIKGDISGGYHYLCHVGTANGQPSQLVKVGDRVNAGQVVGYVNATGGVTGPHLHHTYWTNKWVNVDVVKCFYRKYAPEMIKELVGYVDRNEFDPSNKKKTPCGE